MSRRQRGLLGLVATLAAIAGVGALVLANRMSSHGDRAGGLVALYVVFLVGTLAALAGAVVYSQKSIDQLAAARATAPRHPLRRAAMRTGRRVGRVGRQLGVAGWRGAGVATRNGTKLAARTSRAGARRLGRLWAEFTPERRRAILGALGIEQIEQPGATGSAPTPSRRYAAAHARRRVPAESPIARRYNAFEARRDARSHPARAASRARAS